MGTAAVVGVSLATILLITILLITAVTLVSGMRRRDNPLSALVVPVLAPPSA
jgi:hypothetical protein